MYQVKHGFGDHADSRWRNLIGCVSDNEAPWNQVPATLKAMGQIWDSLEVFLEGAEYLNEEITDFKFTGAALRPYISEHVER